MMYVISKVYLHFKMKSELPFWWCTGCGHAHHVWCIRRNLDHCPDNSSERNVWRPWDSALWMWPSSHCSVQRRLAGRQTQSTRNPQSTVRKWNNILWHIIKEKMQYALWSFDDLFYHRMFKPIVIDNFHFFKKLYRV